MYTIDLELFLNSITTVFTTIFQAGRRNADDYGINWLSLNVLNITGFARIYCQYKINIIAREGCLLDYIFTQLNFPYLTYDVFAWPFKQFLPKIIIC